MKRFGCKISILLFFLISFPLSSCMQWNGDVGDWFGSWYLETILINGKIDTEYEHRKEIRSGDLMVNFQGKVFNMCYVNGTEIYGSWSVAGEILTLIGNYNTGGGASLTDRFNPFPVVMRFGAGLEQVEITVTAINGRTMQWQYINPEGQFLTYNFRKYP